MKRIFFILTGLLFAYGVQAQKEANIWHFGYNAGLDFNTTTASKSCSEVWWNGTAWQYNHSATINNLPSLIKGHVYTYEGCFTISDANGQLLMSSDGTTLYNKNGGTMSTNLGGGSSAAQSGIVIPKPGDSNRYYAVSVPHAKGGKMQYAEVDISLNGGLGGVVSQNNVLTSFNVAEDIAAVPHSNGTDYWLLHRTDNTYYVWKVTNSGFSSYTTFATSSTTTTSQGYAAELIVSPDGTRIAALTYDRKEILTADFDPATGIISNRKSMKASGRLYGGCFSPNSEYFYYTVADGGCHCVSWSALRSGSEGDKMPNLVNIHLASDGRLYGIVAASRTLYVIEDPDNGDLKAKYVDNFFSSSHLPSYGLPTFLSSYLKSNFKVYPLACKQNAREISVEISSGGTNPATQIDWDFGDGTTVLGQPITPNSTKTYTQVHTYTTPGIKTITITPRTSGGIAKSPKTFQIEVIPCAIKTNRMIRTNLKDQGEP